MTLDLTAPCFAYRVTCVTHPVMWAIWLVRWVFVAALYGTSAECSADWLMNHRTWLIAPAQLQAASGVSDCASCFDLETKIDCTGAA